MFYTLYKITNNINGKIYIGCHKTNNLDDGYFGSGKYLKRSINKYGIENFTKEIMYICHSAEEMFDMEEILVDTNFVKRKDTLNIREGGFGGFDHIDNNGENNPRGFLGKHHTEESKIKISKFGKENPMYGKPGTQTGKPGTFLGKHHTEDVKSRIGTASAIHQKGEKNAMYGRVWIYCPYTQENRTIPGFELKEWEDKGWVKGRKILLTLHQ